MSFTVERGSKLFSQLSNIATEETKNFFFTFLKSFSINFFFFYRIGLIFFSGFKELPANGALLLYISADGCFSQSKHHEDGKIFCISKKLKICFDLFICLCLVGYDMGGVVMSSKKEPVDHPNKKSSQYREIHW